MRPCIVSGLLQGGELPMHNHSGVFWRKLEPTSFSSAEVYSIAGPMTDGKMTKPVFEHLATAVLIFSIRNTS